MASLGCASVSHKLVAQIHRYNLIRRPYNKFLAPATVSISFEFPFGWSWTCLSESVLVAARNT